MTSEWIECWTSPDGEFHVEVNPFTNRIEISSESHRQALSLEEFLTMIKAVSNAFHMRGSA